MSISEAAPAAVRPGLYRVTDQPPVVRLLAGECGGCGALTFPAATVCPNCQQQVDTTRELASDGVVYSRTVVRSRPPGYEGPVPYGLGLVDLPDGLRVFGMLECDDPAGDTAGAGDASEIDAPDVGEAVESVEVGVGDGVTSYAFRRAAGGHRA